MSDVRTQSLRPGMWPASQRQRVAFCTFLGIWWRADFVIFALFSCFH